MFFVFSETPALSFRGQRRDPALTAASLHLCVELLVAQVCSLGAFALVSIIAASVVSDVLLSAVEIVWPWM